MKTKINCAARIGQVPFYKEVKVNDETLPLCEMRCYIYQFRNHSRMGIWIPVNVWGVYALPACNLFKKGQLIQIVNGRLVNRPWEKEVEDKKIAMPAYSIDTYEVHPHLLGLESIEMRARTKGAKRRPVMFSTMK